MDALSVCSVGIAAVRCVTDPVTTESTMDKGIFDRNPSGSKRRRTASDDASTFFDFHRGAVIVSVVENRGREVCICKMDTLNVRHLCFSNSKYFSFI